MKYKKLKPSNLFQIWNNFAKNVNNKPFCLLKCQKKKMLAKTKVLKYVCISISMSGCILTIYVFILKLKKLQKIPVISKGATLLS